MSRERLNDTQKKVGVLLSCYWPCNIMLSSALVIFLLCICICIYTSVHNYEQKKEEITFVELYASFTEETQDSSTFIQEIQETSISSK